MTVTNYYEQLYAKKFENPGQNAKFLETYNPPKLLRRSRKPEAQKFRTQA